MRFYLAPLEGITGYIYRNALEKYFPGADRYMTPFIVPDRNRALRTKELRDILPENNRVRDLVPQILTNDADRFHEAVQALGEYGYEEVNLNLGCPSGTVVSRRRGAGLLGFPEELDHFLDRIFSENQVRISVKTRLGMEKPEEAFRLMEIYNQYPLSELIIHPRTRQEYYRGAPHFEIFGELQKLAKMPVCYNGNLLTVRDYTSFCAHFPETEAVMLGRGVIANPALFRELSNDASGGQLPGKLTKEELRAFHDEVFFGYREVFGNDSNAVFRMKEMWTYLLHSFVDPERQAKKIRKARTKEEYLLAVEGIFAACELQPDGPEFWNLPQK